MTHTSEAEISIKGNDSTQRELARIWQKTLGVDFVGPDDDYFDLGGDSSLAVQMFAQVERVFKVKLPLATLYEAPTIKELALILNGELASAGWTPLVAIQPLGSRPPFFCFHGAGGNILIYRKLSKYLGSDQPFYGLQAQGLDGTSLPLTTIEEMAELYVKHIRRVQAIGPYFLGGYCMGGTIAYEVAQRLHSSGEDIALLALFDTMNWNKVPLTLWSKSLHTCQQFLFHVRSVFDLDSEGKVKFLREKFEVLRGRIPVWGGMLLARFGGQRLREATSNSVVLGRIWKANDRASWNYVPKTYRGEILDFRPAKQYHAFNKQDLKWDSLAQGGQRVVVLPVNPGSMLVEPYVKHLSTALAANIDNAISRGRFDQRRAQSAEARSGEPTSTELTLNPTGGAVSDYSAPLVAIQPLGGRPPFFCVHPHGGGVLIYRDLSRHLGADQPFYGLQSPGLDGGCAPPKTIEDMAALYIKEIRRVQPKGPYYLGGYCMGGTIAFEIARQLQSSGETVALLALLDSMNWATAQAPSSLQKVLHRLEWLAFHAVNCFSFDFPGKVKFTREKLKALYFRRSILRRTRSARICGCPDALTSTSLRLAGIWEANWNACANYRPQPFKGIVTDFRPAKQYRSLNLPNMKWDEVAIGGQDVVVVPVNAAGMLIEPFVSHLAAALRRSIDRSIQVNGSPSR